MNELRRNLMSIHPFIYLSDQLCMNISYTMLCVIPAHQNNQKPVDYDDDVKAALVLVA